MYKNEGSNILKFSVGTVFNSHSNKWLRLSAFDFYFGDREWKGFYLN
jgi:hypothetical protein